MALTENLQLSKSILFFTLSVIFTVHFCLYYSSPNRKSFFFLDPSIFASSLWVSLSYVVVLWTVCPYCVRLEENLIYFTTMAGWQFKLFYIYCLLNINAYSLSNIHCTEYTNVTILTITFTALLHIRFEDESIPKKVKRGYVLF